MLAVMLSAWTLVAAFDCLPLFAEDQVTGAIYTIRPLETVGWKMAGEQRAILTESLADSWRRATGSSVYVSGSPKHSDTGRNESAPELRIIRWKHFRIPGNSMLEFKVIRASTGEVLLSRNIPMESVSPTGMDELVDSILDQ